MANRTFLNVPTRLGLLVAGAIVIGFGLVAFGLYKLAGMENAVFYVKLADVLLQGALVGVLFAILKALIDQVPLSPDRSEKG